MHDADELLGRVERLEHLRPHRIVDHSGQKCFDDVVGNVRLQQRGADIRETLARRGAAALRHPAGKARAPQCRRVRSVRVTSPAPGIVEASAVVIGGERARAVALRLEVVRGRWLATAVELG
jgi:hypothetical protein